MRQKPRGRHPRRCHRQDQRGSIVEVQGTQDRHCLGGLAGAQSRRARSAGPAGTARSRRRHHCPKTAGPNPKHLLELPRPQQERLRNGADKEIIDAVANAKDAPDRTPSARRPELPEGASPRRHPRDGLDLTTCPRSPARSGHPRHPFRDVESLLSKSDQCRLLEGWRADLVGEPIRQLVDGDAAVAFDSDGHLVLEARSHQPLPLAPRSRPCSADFVTIHPFRTEKLPRSAGSPERAEHRRLFLQCHRSQPLHRPTKLGVSP